MCIGLTLGRGKLKLIWYSFNPGADVLVCPWWHKNGALWTDFAFSVAVKDVKSSEMLIKNNLFHYLTLWWRKDWPNQPVPMWKMYCFLNLITGFCSLLLLATAIRALAVICKQSFTTVRRNFSQFFSFHYFLIPQSWSCFCCYFLGVFLS